LENPTGFDGRGESFASVTLSPPVDERETNGRAAVFLKGRMRGHIAGGIVPKDCAVLRAGVAIVAAIFGWGTLITPVPFNVPRTLLAAASCRKFGGLRVRRAIAPKGSRRWRIQLVSTGVENRSLR
jgi:hypothetical protein